MAKTPAWQRAAGKNPEGGLNEKGRASLRAAGHDIKRPQPEGGPRKRSFCARMEGMKRENTSAETANDPDSRINKSLRKWKCADGGSVDSVPLPPERPTELAAQDAANAFPAMWKNVDPLVKLSPGRQGGYSETYGPDEPGDPNNPSSWRPAEFPMGRTGIEVYKPETKGVDLGLELLHTDPRAIATRNALLPTISPEQKHVLSRGWEDYDESIRQKLSEQKAMQNVVDAMERSYIANKTGLPHHQGPQRAIDALRLGEDQRRLLDKLYGYTQTGEYSEGGTVDPYDAVQHAAKGGEVWDKPRPKKLGKPEPLSSKEKASAKASAKAAGRPYPNLVDNMRAARADGGQVDDRAHEFVQEQLKSGEPQVPQYVAQNDFPARAARGVEAVDTAASKVNNLLANVAGQPAMRSPEGRTASEVVQSAMPVDPYQAVQQAAMQWREGDKLGAAETMAAGMPMLGIVPVNVAKSIGAPSLPKSEIFERAVASHPGARIEEGSLVLPVVRGQQPEQHMMPSVRGGVFYLPQGDKNLKYYSGNWHYGGPRKIVGETAYNNPLFVKGGTGGKAPEAAYASLLGKDAMKKLESDIGSVAREQWWMEKQDKDLYRERVANFLEEHGVDPSQADYIIRNSRQGNQLRYALQENIIGNEARKAGYDSIIGYGLRRDPQKTPFMSEVFDIRESHYPGAFGDYKLHEQFRANGGEVEGDVQFAPDDPYAKVQEAANLPMMARNEFAMRMPEPEVRYDTGPQPGEAELRSYDPTIKERIYQGIAGTEERPSPERAQFARGISQMAEFAPVLGNVMAGQEAQRRGDTKGMLMAALPVPGMATEARMAEAAISPAQEAAKEAYQRVLNAQGLYSHAAEAAANLPQAKGSYEQMMAMLKTAGVKPEEMRWSGVEQFAGQPVTREQLVSHFEQNAPKIEETFYTADDPRSAMYRYGSGTQIAIPGGENYREVLLHTPERMGESKYRVHFPNGRSVILDKEHQANALAEMYPGSRVEERPQTSEANYRSQHWDQPNVLGHLRMSDRTGPEGEKILHLEELQSDWGQQGRKKGFGKYTELPSDRKVIESKNARGEPVFHVEGPEGKTETAREYSMQNAINSWINNHQGVPSAPYVESTKNWVDLGLKRALKEAAEGGYGKMIWTPGEQQAARYDLSKQIKNLHYVKTDKGYLIAPETHAGQEVPVNSGQPIPENEISDYVGKDIAEKIIGGGESGVLSGLDLSLGGEGMKSFYDKMVPTRLKELLKKIDPQAKIEMDGHEVSSGKYQVVAPNGKVIADYPHIQSANAIAKNIPGSKVIQEPGVKTHSVEITPKIREAVKKGLPLYAKGGEVVNNADPYDNIQLAAKISPRARRASK